MAIEALKKAVENDPKFINAWYDLGWTYVKKKDYEKAGEVIKKIESIARGYSFHFPLTKALFLAGTGERDKALEADRYGLVLAFLAMKDEALKTIEAAIQDDTEFSRAFISYLPLTKLGVYDSLRDDPRFQEIVKREKGKYEQNQKKYAF